jgi:hypothetical protein
MQEDTETSKQTQEDSNKPWNETKEIIKKDKWNKENSTKYERGE